ncbi:MAG: threo-3-hydroxy-L-aspartate ammonia-lyase, partial [Chloroflexota bacterium]|nr:threo-3-hydroxy-L-aspartate ammonia-lyase [Chloroflexota bacterium]
MHPPDDDRLVTLDEFRAAASRIAAVAVMTPLLPFRQGSDGVAFLKPECLQPTGSFKIRGAYNTLSQMTAEERARGVVTHSSGNHAQAIARAARLLGIRALVVMPSNAPAVKVAGVRADGAEIEFVGPHNEERVARAHEIADNDGMVLVPSANHLNVIAGQGTIGLEIVAQLVAAGLTDAPVVLVPVGLGGIAAGVSTAVKAVRPDAHVFGVEPELAADTRESLAARELKPWPSEKTSSTIADGLRGEAPSPIPFRHLLANLEGVVTVSEAEIGAAIAVGAREARVVLEPSGAVSLAALINRRGDLPPGPVV